MLAPLAFDFTGEGSLDTDGLFVPSVATGTGNAAATRFSLSISPDRTPGRDAGVASAVVMLDAPDGGNLFRQLGLPAAATPLGAGHVEVTARGSPKSGYETTLAASVPAAKLAFGGFVGSGSGRGHVAASGSDVAALMKVAGWVGPSAPAGATWSAESDLAWADGKLDLTKLSSRIAGVAASGALGYATAGAPSMPALTGSLKIDTLSLADLTGLALGASGAPGTAGWSSAAFPLMPAWPRAAVALRFGTLTLLPGIAARDAGLTLTLAPSNLTLGDIAGHVLDGTAGGGVTLRRDGASASLSGQIRFDDLALTLPSLGGRISGALNVAGTGANPEALVGSIAGEGTLRIAGATIPRFDPAALSRVAAVFDQEGATIDDQSVGDVLLKALDHGPLSLGDVATPATLAAGTLRVVGLQVKRPDLTASAEGSFSLRNETLTLRTTLASVALRRTGRGTPSRSPWCGADRWRPRSAPSTMPPSSTGSRPGRSRATRSASN